MGLIRLFLALVVAQGHFRLIVLQPAGLALMDDRWVLGFNAGYAVMFFYVISGFLMSLVLSKKYAPNIEGTVSFYKSRVVRIFSVYWPLVVLGLAIFPESRQWLVSAKNIDRLFGAVLIASDWRVALADYPREHYSSFLPYMNQSWTLGVELTFYLIAPFLLRSRGAFITLLVFSLATRAALVACFGFDEAWAYHFFPTTVCFFLLGAAAYKASLYVSILKSPVMGILFLCASVALMFPAKSAFDVPSFWGSILFFSASLPGVFESTKNNRLYNAAGDLSYPLYLVHIIVLVKIFPSATFIPMAQRFAETHNVSLLYASVGLVAAYCLTCILVAAAIHWIIERPVSKLARYLVLPTTVKDRVVSLTSQCLGKYLPAYYR